MYSPKNPQEAIRLAKSLEKAAILFQSGYTKELLYGPEVPDVFLVRSPQGNLYRVNERRQTCSCEDYRRHGRFCKHLIACEITH